MGNSVQTNSNIASTAKTLATARTIGGVSFDGSANISLNNNAITNGGLDTNQMAQAKVVRAYLHWRLMDLYGNVVIADGSGSSSQSSSSTVFNWVEGELLSALGMGSSFDLSKLSSSALGTNDVKYRINQYSALGILAKVYLNAEVYTGNERYSDAAAAAGHIICLLYTSPSPRD